jgi:hypothetical protein
MIPGRGKISTPLFLRICHLKTFFLDQKICEMRLWKENVVILTLGGYETRLDEIECELELCDVQRDWIYDARSIQKWISRSRTCRQKTALKSHTLMLTTLIVILLDWSQHCGDPVR